MDLIDESQVKLLSEAELTKILDLNNQEIQIIREIFKYFDSTKIGYLPLHRGLSTAKKIIIKPHTLYPYLLKIDLKEEIFKEEQGDRILRTRLPAINIPHLEKTFYYKNYAGILYRYLTGGRVTEPVQRLDSYLSMVETYTGMQIFKEIYDITLKKAHWLDGTFEMCNVVLPELESPQEGIDLQNWAKISAIYESVKDKVIKLKAPHGIIHGDLHSKNVLVSRMGEPILIDFNMAKVNSCIFIDYAKMEAALQFQLDNSVTNKLLIKDLHLRIYSAENLILPRSSNGLARYIHEIRFYLWKACLSKIVGMSATDINTIYNAYLTYFLIRFISKKTISEKNRQIAIDEIYELNNYSKVV